MRVCGISLWSSWWILPLYGKMFTPPPVVSFPNCIEDLRSKLHWQFCANKSILACCHDMWCLSTRNETLSLQLIFESNHLLCPQNLASTSLSNSVNPPSLTEDCFFVLCSVNEGEICDTTTSRLNSLPTTFIEARSVGPNLRSVSITKPTVIHSAHSIWRMFRPLCGFCRGSGSVLLLGGTTAGRSSTAGGSIVHVSWDWRSYTANNNIVWVIP